MASGIAKTKFIRVSPRKARLSADVVRGLGVEEAKAQLAFGKQKAGRLLIKTLESAIANALMQGNASRQDLYISEIRVDAGPVMKRAKSNNKWGRVPVMKRTSHFTVIVSARSGL